MVTCVFDMRHDMSQNSIQSAFCHFMKRFNNVLNINSRIIKEKRKSDTHPWTKGCEKYSSITRERNHTRRLMQSDGMAKTVLSNRYREIEKERYCLFAELKKNYFKRLVIDERHKKKDFYRVMHSKTKSNSELPISMEKDGRVYYGDQRVEQLLLSISSNFRYDDNEFTGNDNSVLIGNTYDNFYVESDVWKSLMLFFEEHEVRRAMETLHERKDQGPGGGHPRIFKESAYELAPVFTEIFNSFVYSGFIPSEWKNIQMVPIPKSGDKTKIVNYRGIAIQRILPKLFDKILAKKLSKILDVIMPEYQHGFRMHRSTSTNLLESTVFIRSQLEKCSQVDGIFLDFSKAFDVVDYRILTEKMAKIGMPYQMARIVMNFITGRTYIMKINGRPYMDMHFKPSSSVGQGSHLGPLLFLIYSADISEDIPPSVKILQYADDTKLLCPIHSDEDRIQLQVAIDAICEWSERNKIRLNSAKTHVVHFAKRIDNKMNTIYFIGADRIVATNGVRDLGIFVDKNLLFVEHMNGVLRRVNTMLALAKRFAREANNNIIVWHVFVGYIRPVLEYGSIVWSRPDGSMTRKIESIQRKVTRMALGTSQRPYQSNYLPYDARLKCLQTLTLENRRNYLAAKFVVGALKGNVKGEVARDMIDAYWDTMSRTRSKLIIAPEKNRNGGDWAIRQLINQINDHKAFIDQTMSINTIARHLKEGMLNKQFRTEDTLN